MSHPCPLIYWQIITVQLWRFNVSIGETSGLNNTLAELGLYYELTFLKSVAFSFKTINSKNSIENDRL